MTLLSNHNNAVRECNAYQHIRTEREANIHLSGYHRLLKQLLKKARKGHGSILNEITISNRKELLFFIQVLKNYGASVHTIYISLLIGNFIPSFHELKSLSKAFPNHNLRKIKASVEAVHNDEERKTFSIQKHNVFFKYFPKTHLKELELFYYELGKDQKLVQNFSSIMLHFFKYPRLKAFSIKDRQEFKFDTQKSLALCKKLPRNLEYFHTELFSWDTLRDFKNLIAALPRSLKNTDFFPLSLKNDKERLSIEDCTDLFKAYPHRSHVKLSRPPIEEELSESAIKNLTQPLLLNTETLTLAWNLIDYTPIHAAFIPNERLTILRCLPISLIKLTLNLELTTTTIIHARHLEDIIKTVAKLSLDTLELHFQSSEGLLLLHLVSKFISKSLKKLVLDGEIMIKTVDKTSRCFENLPKNLESLEISEPIRITSKNEENNERILKSLPSCFKSDISFSPEVLHSVQKTQGPSSRYRLFKCLPQNMRSLHLEIEKGTDNFFADLRQLPKQLKSLDIVLTGSFHNFPLDSFLKTLKNISSKTLVSFSLNGTQENEEAIDLDENIEFSHLSPAKLAAILIEYEKNKSVSKIQSLKTR